MPAPPALTLSHLHPAKHLDTNRPSYERLTPMGNVEAIADNCQATVCESTEMP